MSHRTRPRSARLYQRCTVCAGKARDPRNPDAPCPECQRAGYLKTGFTSGLFALGMARVRELEAEVERLRAELERKG